MSKKIEKISADEARRIALAAQGFANPRPSRPDRRHVRRVLAQIGLLQIDSVNVLVRSHYLPLFSRLGSYAPEILDASWTGSPANRELFEYWGHMASLMPYELHPLLRWRMTDAEETYIYRDSDTRLGSLNRRRPGFMQAALDEIRERGALSAREISGAGASKGGWWGWSDGSARSRRCSPRADSRPRVVAASSDCTTCPRESSRNASWPCRHLNPRTRSEHSVPNRGACARRSH